MLESQQPPDDSSKIICIISDDFFTNFLKFYSQVKDVGNVRFSYMKELYNLGLDSFPDNSEVYNIQQNNKLSTQASFQKLKKNWTDDDKKVLVWLVGKMMALHKRDLKQIVFKKCIFPLERFRLERYRQPHAAP